MRAIVFRWCAVCCWLLLAAVAYPAFSQQIPAPLGNYAAVLDKLELENYDGSTLSLSNYKAHDFTLYILLAHDCPICQKYGAKFRELNSKYAADVLQVIGIAPADGVTREKIDTFASTYQLDFPVLLDSRKVFTHVFKGKVTPEVFLVSKEGDLLYRGKIDNWFYELGKYRNVVTENYLDDAIAAALSGNVIMPNKTEPIGCMLNMEMKH